jgi:hypothetical protein
MKEWKQSDEVMSVHDDLYKPSDPGDESSDTFFSLIFRSVFGEKEMTTDNLIWTQSVLETIFDVDHLSTKVDSDIIDVWKDAIKRDGQVKSHVNGVVLYFFFFVTLLNIYLYLGASR